MVYWAEYRRGRARTRWEGAEQIELKTEEKGNAGVKHVGDGQAIRSGEDMEDESRTHVE